MSPVQSRSVTQGVNVVTLNTTKDVPAIAQAHETMTALSFLHPPSTTKGGKMARRKQPLRQSDHICTNLATIATCTCGATFERWASSYADSTSPTGITSCDSTFHPDWIKELHQHKNECAGTVTYERIPSPDIFDTRDMLDGRPMNVDPRWVFYNPRAEQARNLDN